MEQTVRPIHTYTKGDPNKSLLCGHKTQPAACNVHVLYITSYKKSVIINLQQESVICSLMNRPAAYITSGPAVPFSSH
jgi:hypothetical protein